MIEAVIFDMDGVMVDTEHIQSQAFESVLSEYGIIAKKNEHGTIHTPGATTEETWEALKSTYNFEAETEELSRKKRDTVISVLQKGVEPFAGLIELLEDLTTNHIALAVATAAKRERADLVLDKLGITQYFTVVVSANDIKHGKPAPDPYLKAAELLGVTVDNCVVIEDAAIGVESAKAAGMKCAGVPNEHTRRMNFGKADLIVTSLRELDYRTLVGL